VHEGLERAHRHRDVRYAAQRRGEGGDARGEVAGVGDDDRVGVQQVGAAGNEGLQAAGALFLRPLGDELDPDRKLALQGAQGGQVHHDVALAVGGAAPVPASVALGELKHR
jgi:hypothetical protein